MLDLSCIISSGDLELYVLDQLPPKEREQIAALAQIFPEVKEEIQRIEAGVEKLASAEAVTPSSHLKDSVLSKIAAIPLICRRFHQSNDPETFPLGQKLHSQTGAKLTGRAHAGNDGF